MAQLEVMKAYLDLQSAREPCKLLMAGSVRSKGDEDRVNHLKSTADKLGISEHVHFVINPPYPELVKLFGRASIGLSTMVDEHFGISVVEFMAAGLIPLVHASGGPLLDIVITHNGQPTGQLSTLISSAIRADVEQASMRGPQRSMQTVWPGSWHKRQKSS